MIVPRGAKFFPNQAPLLGMTIPTVEGNLRLGYSPRAKRRGMGLLLPIDPTVPQPRTNRRTIPVRGVGVSRGFGRYRGLGADYCSSNPPDAATAAILAARGDSVDLIDCAPGTTTNPANPGGSFQNKPNAMIGTQPVEVLPPIPAYADCNPAAIGEAASTACAAKNQQMQADWITASGIARNDFNRNTCLWNGQPASYCNTVYPPGYSGGNSPTTQPIAIRGPSAPSAPAKYNPVATFTTPNGQTPQVGDPWSISIKGAAPNAQVVVTQTINGGAPKSGQFGTSDGNGNFAASGTFTPDTVGSWTESWTVGGAPAGSFNFQVVVPIPPPNGGTTNPPASKTPPSALPSTTAPPTVPGGGGVPAGGGLNLGGFDLSAVPVWGWVAAGLGAVILFGGKH